MITNSDVLSFPWRSAKDLTSHGAGVPLDSSTRSWMELRFGRPFGDVRVHTGRWAGAAAQALGARAFTFGSHIYFAAGEYSPHTTEGRRLLAHEVVHVVQQRGALATTDRGWVGVGDAQDPLEAEAQRVAGEVLGSGPISPIHPDAAPAIRRVIQIDPDSKASLTFDSSVRTKAKPKVDILSTGTRRIAFSHLTEGFNLGKAIAGTFPVDDAVIKLVGKFDVVMDPGDKLLDFEFGIIQIGQVFALEDTYVGRTLNEGHLFMKHLQNVSPTILLDSEASFAPFASRSERDTETKGKKDITHVTCNLGILPDPKKKGDSPHGFSAAVVLNRKTNADNFLFETRTDVNFTSVLVAIDPQKKVQPLVHVTWHLVWHFQFRWKGSTDPTATAIPIKSGADFSLGIKGAPTNAAIAALVAKPAGAFMNPVTIRAKQQTALGQPPNREDNFSRPGGIPADFFT